MAAEPSLFRLESASGYSKARLANASDKGEDSVGQPLEQMLKVQAEMRVPVGTVQLVQIHVEDPTDIVMFDRDAYWLELCLEPRARNSRACYLDHWTAQRFKRIGKTYLLPPGETIQTRTDGGPSHTSILCHLRPESMRKWFDGDLQWTDRRLEASLDIADANVRALLLRLADEMQHPGFASKTLVELITAQLMIELGRYFCGFDEIPLAGELAPWRLQLIDERLREVHQVPTLQELATLCKLSVRQLTRGFRASRGCSIGDYIVNSRIDRAKELLARDQNIKTIAYSLGFSSPSAFCFAFRRATGMTPGEFRASGAAARVGSRTRLRSHA
jgi:AraC family transcriptional regulator